MIRRCSIKVAIVVVFASHLACESAILNASTSPQKAPRSLVNYRGRGQVYEGDSAMELYQSLRIDSSGIGSRFGGWTQIGPAFSCQIGKQRLQHAVCECDCGAVSVVHLSTKFRAGRNGGCWKCRIREANSRHGLSSTPEYAVWKAMIQRCTDNRCDSYQLYGGRGISVCGIIH